MGNLVVAPYAPPLKPEWDAFVRRSKNATFLFERSFMEYHSDRFVDASLVVRSEGEVVALFPANRDGPKVVSHGGLSYGGVLTDEWMTTGRMLTTFAALLVHLREQGVESLHYKVIPHIYARAPSEEDAYALHRLGATLVRRDVSSSVDCASRLKRQQRRERGAKRAQKAGVTVVEDGRLPEFWAILDANLQERHGRRPVHSLSEIELLAGLFPGNVRLHLATLGGEVLAGVLAFVTERVAHAQYIASSPQGRELGALDLLFATLLDEVYASKRYFDFGISTEDEGRRLNAGLIDQKEGFGARAVVHDFYQLSVADAVVRSEAFDER